MENDEREHNTIKKVAGEVPILLPLGEQQGNDTSQRKAQIKSQASACLYIPVFTEGSASGTLITKSKPTALWCLWHVTIPLEQPHINVLKVSTHQQSPQRSAEVPWCWAPEGFFFQRAMGPGTMAGQLHPQLMEMSTTTLIFNSATSQLTTGENLLLCLDNIRA